MFRQLEAWMTEHTGYPTVSGHEEFLYEPDKPLRGDLTDYAYNQRGALALRDRAVGPVQAPRHGAPAEVRAVLRARLARRPRQARVVGPRRERRRARSRRGARSSIRSSGAVEIGGIDPRVGIWNPPLHELPTVCATQAQVFLRVAALAPRLRIGRDRAPPAARRA